MTKISRILVLGASGMLGNAVLRLLAQSPGHAVVGSVRSAGALRGLPTALHAHVVCGVDVENFDSLTRLFATTRPDIVINCGILAAKEGKIGDGTYHGVPVYSLYGERSSPTSTTLDGIDTLVFDLQDAGARFYTYASTMKLAMKVAADRKLRFVVLDRPNPLGGLEVAGPVLDAPGGFVNHHALPIRHGMTMGELARLFADDDHLDVRLDVVQMQGWRRKDYFDHTGLSWVSPSPNLRSVEEVVLYPAVGLLESTNISVGRGTDTPFEVIGAPYIDGEVLAKNVEARAIPGLAASPISFTPTTSVHQGKKCGGLRLRVTDRALFDPVAAAIALALAIHDHAAEWDLEHMDRMLQSKTALDAMRGGKSVEDVIATWKQPLATFIAKRDRFLLY